MHFMVIWFFDSLTTKILAVVRFVDQVIGSAEVESSFFLRFTQCVVRQNEAEGSSRMSKASLASLTQQCLTWRVDGVPGDKEEKFIENICVLQLSTHVETGHSSLISSLLK